MLKTKNTKLDVLCIGGIVRDIFVRPAKTSIISIREPNRDEKLLAFNYGGKVKADDLQFTRGGGGCNAAISFTRMSIATELVGAVGDDEIADDLLHELHEEGVSTKFVFIIPDNKTGLSVIINSFEGERTIIAYRGANEHLRLSPTFLEKLPTASWLYLTSLSGSSNNALDLLARFARKQGMKIAFNPGSSQIALGSKALKPVLQETTALMMNVEEAEKLVGIERTVYRTIKQHGRIVGVQDDNTMTILKKLYALGPKLIIVTNGNKGTLVYDGTYLYSFGTYPQHVVDTLGAGDAFGSGFVAGLIKKPNDIAFALKLGTANATSVVSCYGAQEGLLSYKKACEFIEKHPGVKVGKTKLL